VPRSANPYTFVVTRDFAYPVAAVFGAFTTLEAKAQWFGGEASGEVTLHTLDFRVGGWEHWRGKPKDHTAWMTNDTLFYDIIPDERIIIGYSMTMDGKLFTVSQQVLEFSVRGAGSQLKLTEQILYIDGVDHHENRVRGTEDLLAGLEAYLGQRG
jgi:uncharacterized protein YndB with AHSA1/START domain